MVFGKIAQAWKENKERHERPLVIERSLEGSRIPGFWSTIQNEKLDGFSRLLSTEDIPANTIFYKYVGNGEFTRHRWHAKDQKSSLQLQLHDSTFNRIMDVQFGTNESSEKYSAHDLWHLCFLIRSGKLDWHR